MEWRTTSEQYNDFFEVEHSIDGRVFTTIGRIKASNLNYGSTYNWQHNGFVTGNNYYRIRQADLDGRFSHSNIAVAVVNGQKQIVVYPNPVDNILHIDLRQADVSRSEVMTMRISNTIGQVVLTKNITGQSSKVTVSLSGLPAGIYTLNIRDKRNKNIMTEKIIKNK